MEFGEEHKESIKIDGKRDFKIYLPFHSSPLRDRFTIAHELGHYILHSRLAGVEKLKATRSGHGRVEWEANWFAAGLLMPADIFKEKYDGPMFSIPELCSFFGVSSEAIHVRAQSLGL